MSSDATLQSLGGSRFLWAQEFQCERLWNIWKRGTVWRIFSQTFRLSRVTKPSPCSNSRRTCSVRHWMKLLLDESVPRRLAAEFPSHFTVCTVQEMGWDGISNENLLRRAADARFDLLVTVDQGFQYQQNLASLPIPVLLLKAGRARLPDLKPLVPKVLSLLSHDLNSGVHLVSDDRGTSSGQG